MKKFVKAIWLVFILCTVSLKAQNWICSEKDNFFQMKSTAKEGDGIEIQINPNDVDQVIDGWGGSFNEIGWAALLQLQEKDENIENALENPKISQVMEDIFGNDGLNFNLCRVPMGPSDFTVDTRDPVQRDRYKELIDKNYIDLSLDKYYEFQSGFDDAFTIDRDRLFLLPYIKAAQKIKPDLNIWTSPWTAPFWMMDMDSSRVSKYSHMNNVPVTYAGKFKGYSNCSGANKYIDAYTEYFANYILAYRKEGINVNALQIQNEFSDYQYWVSCNWLDENMTATCVNEFINKLSNRFNNEKLIGYSLLKDIDIWHGTIHPDIENDPVNTFEKEVKPAVFNSNIKGVGFQYLKKDEEGNGFDVINLTRNSNSTLKIMATETFCGNKRLNLLNNWDYGIRTWEEMHDYLIRGANSYMQWNMILDEETSSSFKVGRRAEYWPQSAMITIHTEKDSVIYNPQFYIVKHFSHFVEPGAKRIVTTDSNYDTDEDDNIDFIAFKNPNGQIVLQVKNSNKVTKSIKISLNNDIAPLVADLPAESVNTILINQELAEK